MSMIVRPLLIKLPKKGRVFNSKAAWKTVGGKEIYFRSDWEYKAALCFENWKRLGVITEWEHEPKTFWFEEIKRGVRSYLPDFRLTYPAGNHVWIEVKGYMDAKSKTKIKRFRKYYPEETLRVLDSDWFTTWRDG